MDQRRRPPGRDPYAPNQRPARQDVRYVRRMPRRRRSKSRLLSVVLLPLATVAVFFILFSNPEPAAYPGQGLLPEDYYYQTNYEPNSMVDLEIPVENVNRSESTLPNPSIPLTRIPVGNINDTGYLALVNRQHPIQAKPHRGLLTGAWPTVAVSRVDDMYLHHSALYAVSAMFASARQADIAAFFVSSGFRSYDAQVLLYGDGSNSAYVQPPGHSEHHTGLAADILAPGVGMMEMANTPEGQWLAANSYRYGLILRYPEGATEITGIAFEPWHFRYVGRAHAYYMKRNNLVLEEYIARIHNAGHFSFEKNGVTHHVLHQIPEDGMVYLPYTHDFIVSGDNKGGFIVIAW